MLIIEIISQAVVRLVLKANWVKLSVNIHYALVRFFFTAHHQLSPLVLLQLNCTPDICNPI